MLIVSSRAKFILLFFCVHIFLTNFVLAEQIDQDSIIPNYSQEKRKELYANIRFREVETLLTQESFRDLEIPLLQAAIDYSKLASGSVELARLIQPISDISKLNLRQSILQELLANDSKLFNELNQAVKQFSSDYEDAFLSLVDIAVLPEKQVFAEVIKGTFAGIGTVLLFGDLRRDFSNDRAHLLNTNSWYQRLNMWRSIVLKLMGFVFVTYQASKDAMAFGKTVSEADEFVLRFAKAMMAMQRINAVLVKSELLSNVFPGFSDFQQFASKKPALAWVLQKLENRLETDNSWWVYWSMKDSILLYDGIRLLKGDFIKTLWWLSRVDAYLSVLRWTKEWEESGRNISFVEYKEGIRPEYNLEGLINPTIKDAAENTFDMKGHAVLTGPHALGKTSSMRSIAYAHILGQSVGIVPAKKASLVPVSGIKTYFNIGDSNGESSFQAELRRMSEFLAMAKNESKKPLLFLIDEPFAKTPSLIGNKLLREFLNNTLAYSNLGMVLSTHLEEPSRFVDEHVGLMQNFQPDIQEKDGQFITNYKIVSGAANWWLNNENDKTNAYVKWLIEKDPDTAKLWFKETWNEQK